MMTTAVATPVTWDQETQAFIEANGLGELLPKLVEAVRQIFPDNEGLSVYVEDDPEIADLRSVMIDVVDPHSSLDEYMRRRDLWHEALFRLEGKPHRCLVCLRIRSQA